MRLLCTLLGSFYSRDTYRQVRAGKGYGLGYSFFLVVVNVLVWAAIASYGVSKLHHEVFGSEQGAPPAFDSFITHIAAQVPVMTMKDSRLQTHEPKIYYITADSDQKLPVTTLAKKHKEGSASDEQDDAVFLTIDTTGTTTHKNMKTTFLLTATDLIMKGDEQTKIESLKEAFDQEGTLIINRALIDEVSQGFIHWVHKHIVTLYLCVGLFLALLVTPFLYAARIVLLMVIALGGLLFAKLIRTPADYETCMRLTAVSFTPVLFISTLVKVGGLSFLSLVLCGVIMVCTVLLITREPSLAAPV